MHQDWVLGASDWSHAAFADRQRRWLDSSLASSTADWKIVIGHYPVLSIAESGPTAQLVDELKPRHGVAMYLGGHDHSTQHLSDNGVEYLVIATGTPVESGTQHEFAVPEGSKNFHWARTDLMSNASLATTIHSCST